MCVFINLKFSVFVFWYDFFLHVENTTKNIFLLKDPPWKMMQNGVDENSKALLATLFKPFLFFGEKARNSILGKNAKNIFFTKRSALKNDAEWCKRKFKSSSGDPV